MRAVANDPAVAKRTGVSRKVAAEFNRADPGGVLPEKKSKLPPKRKENKP